MALATKCPHCNTIFRVAHDQLKLRGGIVRCGACHEVFDGTAALVEPALKQPVIIDLPSAPTPAPTSSPELEALITTLDARAGEAEHGEAFDLDLDLDLDIDIDEEPQDALSIGEVEARPARASDEPPPAAPGEPPEVSPEGPAEAQEAATAPSEPAYPPLSALDDEERAHERQDEPALEEADEHLTAVALHDSFELDAYPARSAERDELEGDVVTLSAAGRADAEADTDTDTGAQADGEDDAGTAASAHAAADDAVTATDTDADADADADAADADAVDAAAAAATPAEPAPGPAAPASGGLAAAGLAAGQDDDEPGFVKRDRRRKQVGKAAKVAMAVGIPLLLAALAAQVLGTFRNPLAAAVPSLKPALVSACALAGCTVELPAQIDALSIEQGELQTLADNVFSFTTTLRNGARSAQAWPHIELILNDDAGKPVLRRVFAPREYLAATVAPADMAKGFAPRSEQSVKLYFELAQIKASGYHIAVFYP
jgi:predicted Zn finger-like uncharacterized protein